MITAAIVLLVGLLFSAYTRAKKIKALAGEIDFIKVQVGTFMMGCTAGQGDDSDDSEKPAHRVTLDPRLLSGQV